MKKAIKITSVVLVVMMVIASITPVFAKLPFEPKDVNAEKGSTSVDSVNNIGNDIVRILSAIGIVVSVAVLIVLGIKYMMGSAEEKAEYKKTMVPYLVGVVLIFAASVIATVVYNFASGIKA